MHNMNGQQLVVGLCGGFISSKSLLRFCSIKGELWPTLSLHRRVSGAGNIINRESYLSNVVKNIIKPNDKKSK